MDGSPANQVSLHVPQMYSVAYRLLADADQAHDVVQEACIKALGGMMPPGGQSTSAMWPHRIAGNCARDAMWSSGRKSRDHEALQSQRANRMMAKSPANGAECPTSAPYSQPARIGPPAALAKPGE